MKKLDGKFALPHKFRVNSVGAQPRPGGYDPGQALPLSNCEILNSYKKARRENLPPPPGQDRVRAGGPA